MPVQINITGGFAQEVLEELATLAKHLGGVAPVAAAAAPEVETPKPEKQSRTRNTTKQEQQAPVEKEEQREPQSEPDPVPADAPSEGTEDSDGGYIPTVVELRAKAQEVGTTPEAKKSIKALLDEFGSKSISDVPENQRAAFLARLEELA